MRINRFLNMLRTLRSIDGHELGDAFPHPDDRTAFVRDPVGYFVRCSMQQQVGIWTAICRRQTWTDCEKPVEELREVLEGLLDGDKPAHDSRITYALDLLDEIEKKADQ